MKRLLFALLAVAALLLLMVISTFPALAGWVTTTGQLGLFTVAGARVADLLFGDIANAPHFLAGVGGLLVGVALIGLWFPALAYPAGYIGLLRAVGVSFLVLPPLLPPFARYRGRPWAS